MLKKNSRKTIIAIGASAGGLETFITLLKKIKMNSSTCVIFSQHLDPSHPSLSVEIVNKAVKGKVVEIKNRMRISGGTIYIQPSNTILKIAKDTFTLSRRTTKSQTHIIGLFFQSLAKNKSSRLIGVLLSGHGKDGSLGLKVLKDQGAQTYVQDPASAKSKEMVRNAILLEPTHMVLPVEGIARSINKIIADPESRSVPVHKQKLNDQHISEILAVLKRDLNVDFTLYKPSTILRRIKRRMSFNKITSLEKYLQLVNTNPAEAKLFCEDILIHVTTFFRDPVAFEQLKKIVFPEILKNKKANQPLRIWVAGCSTGEEAYSLAILLTEFLHEQKAQNTFQIFATDISEAAIHAARAGVYGKGIEKHITPARLKKYFEKQAEGYKINKHIRDLCLFSKHDMTSDPPFGKLDLVSCRNVLIYFSSLLQKRIIPLFHFSLSPKGYLWLGRSEAPTGFLKLFGVMDQESRLYFKKDVPSPVRFSFSTKTETKDQMTTAPQLPKDKSGLPPGSVDRLILDHYALPGVVINAELDVVQYRGRCAPFLEASLGQPSHNILKLAHNDIQPGLRLLLKKALSTGVVEKRQAISLSDGSNQWLVDLEVTPLNPAANTNEKNYLVVFRGSQQKSSKVKTSAENVISRDDLRILMSDLADAKESHRALLEDYEHGQEEITSANEELQSANEELQSTNEELETAKEELQSTNEELTTVNEELQIRNGELTIVGSDLTNLLASSEIPILMVDSSGKIKRFTPEAKKAFSLHSSDIGKNIKDIEMTFGIDLLKKIKIVGESLEPKKLEVQDAIGLWKQLQIRPYKTLDDKIDGVSITLVDIDQIKQKEKYFKESLDYIKSVADTVPLPFAVIGADYQLKSANQAFYQFFQIDLTIDRSDIFAVLDIPEINRSQLEQLIATNILTNRSFSDYELQANFSKIGERRMLLSGGKVQWVGDEPKAVLVSFIDITERSRLENELKSLLVREREARNEAEKANRAKDVFLATLSHELRTPLSAILTWSQLIGHSRVDAAMTKQGAAVIEQSAKAQSQLIDDLLDISRIISGKLALTIKEVDPATVIRAAVESVRALSEKKSIDIQLLIPVEQTRILADPVRLQQIIWNILTNAIKFSSKGGLIEIRLETILIQDRHFSQISVRDFGKGIPTDFIENIFNRFSQADSASTRTHGGLGLGLSIVRNLVELQGGKVKAENATKGTGAILTVSFPVISAQTDVISPSAQKSGETLMEDKIFPCLEGLRILFVEDDDNTREALAIYLKSFGAKLSLAANAQEAMKLLNGTSFDIIVSDIAMPKEDGYALMKKIRNLADPQKKKIPAIALTAFATLDDSSHALKVGFQAHVAKPVEASELAHLILKTIKSP